MRLRPDLARGDVPAEHRRAIFALTTCTALEPKAGGMGRLAETGGRRP